MFNINKNILTLYRNSSGNFDMEEELRWVGVNYTIYIDTVHIPLNFNDNIILTNNIKNLYLSEGFNKPLNYDLLKNLEHITLFFNNDSKYGGILSFILEYSSSIIN